MEQNRNGTLDRTIDVLERVGIIIAGTLFILNVANIVIAVFSRYVLLSSFIWTSELSRFIMVWMILIAAAPAQKRGEHMKIDLLLKYFPPTVNKVLAIIRHTLIIGISVFMTLWGFTYANSIWDIVTLGLKIPKSIPLFSIPTGMLLFLVMYILLRLAGKPELNAPKEGV